MPVLSLQVSDHVQSSYDEFVALMKETFPDDVDPGLFDTALTKVHDIIMGEGIKKASSLWKQVVSL